jgi:hypothetical protein
MSCVHPAVSAPLISVNMNAIFFIGESNPAMSWLSLRYPLTSLMKSSALAWSPVNTWGSTPIVLTSPAGGTGCCGTFACPGLLPGILGPPSPLGPPGLPGPVGPPPLGGPVHHNAVLNFPCIDAGVAPAMGIGLAALAGDTVTIGAILVADMLLIASRGLISTGLCLISWSMGSGSGSSLLSKLDSVLSLQSYVCTLGAGSPSLGSLVSLS